MLALGYIITVVNKGSTLRIIFLIIIIINSQLGLVQMVDSSIVNQVVFVVLYLSNES